MARVIIYPKLIVKDIRVRAVPLLLSCLAQDKGLEFQKIIQSPQLFELHLLNSLISEE